MSEDDIFDMVRAYLVAVDAEATILTPGRPTLTEFIRGYQTAPRPEGTYAQISMIALRDNGEADHVSWRDVTIGAGQHAQSRVVETKTRSLEIKARIDIYGRGSTDFARFFAAALRADRAIVDMPGLAVRDVNDSTLANELKGQLWESHAYITAELAFLGSDEFLIDVIDKGSIEIRANSVTVTTEYERT